MASDVLYIIAPASDRLDVPMVRIGRVNQGVMLICNIVSPKLKRSIIWAGGATVARSTPDRKAACSNHVRLNIALYF